MKTYVLFTAVFVMLSCGTLFSSKGDFHASPPPKATADAASTCPQQQTVIDLIADLEACEAKLKTCAPPVASTVREGADPTGEEPRHHVVVRYVNKNCADSGPIIEPVPSAKCLAGQLCLDDEGQRVLAKNIAAYEAWVQRVKDCESK